MTRASNPSRRLLALALTAALLTGCPSTTARVRPDSRPYSPSAPERSQPADAETVHAFRKAAAGPQIIRGSLEQSRAECSDPDSSLMLMSRQEQTAPSPATAGNGYTKQCIGDTGTLVRPNSGQCSTLKVYFPGHAQELGLTFKVPPEKRGVWADTLLEGDNYHLAPTIVHSGCPVLILGESKMKISAVEVERLMQETGTTQLELLSHSGGYWGLNSTLKEWKGSKILEKVSGLAMLDNFYDTAMLPFTLEETFTRERIRSICKGFYTSHNAARMRSRYEDLCPKVESGGDHKASVKEFFR